jgi:transposase
VVRAIGMTFIVTSGGRGGRGRRDPLERADRHDARGAGLFAQSLGREDLVALEVTGGAWEIARIFAPHVARVIVVSPADTAIRQARAKTDRLDARALARLLAAGALDDVWVPDEQTWVLRRRLARRAQLVGARTRAKNEIHAVVIRRLIGRPPMSDLFGIKGRRWLTKLELPVEERETLDSGLRQIAFLDGEIGDVDRLIARDALGSSQIRRLMTVPGVNVIVAATFLAALGDIARFESSRKLVGYLRPGPSGPSVRLRTGQPRPHLQAGLAPGPVRPGRGVLERRPPARPAARVLRARARPPRPPDRHRGQRTQARLSVLVLLTRQQDYAFAQPSLRRKKLRRLELLAGAPTSRADPASGRPIRRCDRPSASSPSRPKPLTPARSATGSPRPQAGVSATPGRASQGPARETPVARQTTSP